MLEIVTGVDIRYQGLFVRMRMSEMRALAAKGGHTQVRRLLCLPLSFESRQDRVVCKTSNFQGFFPLQGPRGHSRDFRKDLPICGSQFESGYKSE